MFHLAMVLEEGDVVDRRLDAQNQTVLIVHLHLGFAEAMLDAGSLDAGLKARADLLGELRRDLLAEETGDMLGLHRQHRLAGKPFIQGLEGLSGAKDKIEGILHLHQAPVVALVEGLQDRAAHLGVTVEHLMQLLGFERIRERLRSPPVIDPHKRIVGKGKADAGVSESPRQPGRVRCNRTAAGRDTMSARADNPARPCDR